MHTRTIFVFLCLLTACSVQAQLSRTLTLQEAIDLGVTNSKQLALSESKVKEAQAKVAEARDKMWPELSVSATYLRINTPNISVSDNVGSGSGSGSSPFAAFANLHSLGLAQVTLTESIFAGFRVKNNKLMAEYFEQAARYDAQTNKGKVKLTTARAFYQYYELLQTRNVVSENLKQEQQRVKEFKNQEEQKLLARNDRLKAELLVNNVELTLTELNNNVKLAEYNLTILLGLPVETIFEIDTVGMFSTSSLSSWDEYLQQGLENRNELKAAQYQIKASESGYKIAKANQLPTLAFSGGLINAYVPNIITITNALNAGLSFKYNITGAIHSRYVMQEARSHYQQAEVTEQLLTDQASIEIKRNYLKYQASLEKLSITNRAIAQAQENFQITQNKYNQGLVILSDYLDADVLLLQARINHATTKAESMIAYYELQESIGSL